MTKSKLMKSSVAGVWRFIVKVDKALGLTALTRWHWQCASHFKKIADDALQTRWCGLFDLLSFACHMMMDTLQFVSLHVIMFVIVESFLLSLSFVVISSRVSFCVILI